jgi:hypothetical protein
MKNASIASIGSIRPRPFSHFFLTTLTQNNLTPSIVNKACPWEHSQWGTHKNNMPSKSHSTSTLIDSHYD